MENCGFTHGLLGQCILEAAAQWLLGGWPRVRGLGMWQQVLGGGWAFCICPFYAVHLNGSFRRVMDTHVHHGGRSLHWGAGRGGLRAVPRLEGRVAELLQGLARAQIRPPLLPARLSTPGLPVS